MASPNYRKISIIWIGAATILLTSLSPLLSAEPTVPGFIVEDYADVDTPGFMSFDPAGVLFVGNNSNGVSIHRVGIGGAPVEDFGPATRDPDAVLVDAAGTISGTIGAVLVGGANDPGVFQGYIIAILPDESAVPLFGSPTSVFLNPSCMDFDSTGRFLFTDARPQGIVFQSTGGVPTALYNYGSPYPALALDPSDNIYTLDRTGQVIQVHSSGGMLINGSFASHTAAITEMAFAPVGMDWGPDLYAVVGSTGELLRIDESGVVTVMGSGFNNPGGLAFGNHDGLLYISSVDDNRIYSISTPGDVIFNPISDSYFQLVYAPEGINWYEARDAAETMVYRGRTGHLATYASAEEEEVVIDAFPEIEPNYVWLGASDEASEDDWRWLTGEPWEYVNWNSSSSEPNGRTYENCLDYGNDITRWNDESCLRGINYYLVEFSLTPQPGILIEAESMKLETYRVEMLDFASNGALINLKGPGLNGSATTAFAGSSGKYDIFVVYHDENDGNAMLTVSIAGVAVDSWVLDQRIPGGEQPKEFNRFTRQIATDFTVNNGDEIRIDGLQGKWDHANVDYIEFRLRQPPAPIRMEAEAMRLVTYKIEALDFVSGGALINLKGPGREGSAQAPFSGASGQYDVNVVYHDENDGVAQLMVSIACVPVDSWVLDQRIPGARHATESNRFTRQVASGISVNNGDIIRIDGIQGNWDHANVDYVEFVPVP